MIAEEFKLIEALKKKVPFKVSKGLGIGDDAALFEKNSREYSVIATDTIVENIDFKLETAKPEEIGYKALAVNLSDIAAMGAKPTYFLATLGIPERLSKKKKWLTRFYAGMNLLAQKYAIPCIGGDITKARDFFLSVTVLGVVAKRDVTVRSGAKVGDRIFATGHFGGSIHGKHLKFKPRVEEGAFLARNFKINSMIDVSDGLVQDLEHILRASRVGAKIDVERIPVSSDVFKKKRKYARQALCNALSDGEDFELLFTVSKSQTTRLEYDWKKKFPRVPLCFIGEIQKGTPKIQYTSGDVKISLPLLKKGYSHLK